MECKKLEKGIIVSIQQYHYKTISELAQDAINAGAIAIRTDKKLAMNSQYIVPIIGLHKIKVNDPHNEAYITPTIEDIEKVYEWADYIAIDYRRVNKNLKKISDYCRERKLHVVADIRFFEDYQNIKDNDYYYDFVATTCAVFDLLFKPNLRLIEKIINTGEKKLIAEGNFTARKEVCTAMETGVHNVCIGSAISNVYKLTKKFTSITGWA